MNDHYVSGYVPTEAEVIYEILRNYRIEALDIVLNARIGALGHDRPARLMGTAEGRQRVWRWARSLSEGVMG